MSYIDVPAKVLECFISSQTGAGAWPFDDNTGDPFWQFGSSPRDYRWKLTISVSPQSHSSHKTRIPRRYDGMDVKVGDYVASTVDGTALRIIRIDQKTETEVTCIAEDVFRYNTFRDESGAGNGLFTVPCEGMIFEVNDMGLPVVDPLPPSGVGPSFYANVMSRFQNLENLSNFILFKPAHGFAVGQLISADQVNNTFVLTDDDHPYLIGSVGFVNSPDHFTINPIQKIVDDLDALEGDVGDILYADPNDPGGVTTALGTNPVMIKLRDFTQTSIRSTIANASTPATNAIILNGLEVTIGGSGDLHSLVSAVNTSTNVHGVTASVIPAKTVAETDFAEVSAVYGEVLLRLPCSAQINGVTVEFTSSTYGSFRYGDPDLATAEDIAADIMAANIANLTATVVGGSLVLTNNEGAGINISNLVADANGTPFAGEDSATGLPLVSVAPGGAYVRLRASDARAINIANKIGTPVQDFGLFSVENGTKAAAIYIEQGIRMASNYVVPDIAGRNALPAILGDQAYVIDKGDGEWGLYLYSGGSWIVISTAESTKVDSDTYVAVMTVGSETVELGEVGVGCKVTSVTFEVTTPFDGEPTISVGDDDNIARLAGNESVDLGTAGSYVVNPSHVFLAETMLKCRLTDGLSSVGSVTVTVTYQ